MKNIDNVKKEEYKTSLRNCGKIVKLLFFVSLVIVLALVDLVLHKFKGVAIYLVLGILILLAYILLISLKNIVLRQKFLKMEIEDSSDELERTKFGILKLVTGEKIESTFILPKYRSSNYIDSTNNTIYHSDQVVGFQILERKNLLS